MAEEYENAEQKQIPVEKSAQEAAATEPVAGEEAAQEAPEAVRTRASVVEAEEGPEEEPEEAEAVDDSREGKVPSPAVDAAEAVRQVALKIADAATRIGAATASTVVSGAKAASRAVTDPENPVRSATTKAATQVGDAITEAPMRTAFARVGADLYASGAVTSHGGNLSQTDGKHIWITRTNSMLGHLGSRDVIKTSWEESETDAECSRELVVHRAIYHALAQKAAAEGREFTGAAIVHAHTTNTIFRSLIEDQIEPVESESHYTLGHAIKVFAPAVSISSPEAAQMLAEAVGQGEQIAVLRGHGPFAVADDLEGALRLVSVLEQAAKVANLRDATGKVFI
ncbi:MAG: class II aldolase/adducin family protein [Coriobacteriales bacterium]|nr:class II aldolase/adducin family protein [Coriobacteriales bacterium]